MTVSLTIPPIIQGGMGVGISDWRLARAVSLRGQLGVVSGTALDTVMVRRLQDSISVPKAAGLTSRAGCSHGMLHWPHVCGGSAIRSGAPRTRR